jgi:hypothetical protein
MNQFNDILNHNFKSLYNDAIDALLDKSGLSVPCLFRYDGAQNTVYCNNCIFDTISQLSANKYNGTGATPFPTNAVCPVCMGMGKTISPSSGETIYLACIFNSKYWVKMSSQVLNVPDGSVQTLCKNTLLPKIRNAKDIIIDTTNIGPYGNYTYQRAGDPEPVGLGDHRYIITMWTRK